MKHSIWKTAITVALVFGATTAMSATEPGPKCKAAKNKIVGAYYACRTKAEATAIAKGGAADFSKCDAKFAEKWDGAETAGLDQCPDNIMVTASIENYIAGQATDAAGVVAGTTAIPTCGDGAINVAGEHCDGAALDGNTCASFGLHGTLACTSGCDFDLSGCTACPAPGVEYGGACWVLGAVAGSCTTACSGLGLVYDDATSIIAGSSGSNTNCTAVLNAVSAVGTGLDYPDASCAAAAVGCSVNTHTLERARCATPATTAGGSSADIRRACACK